MQTWFYYINFRNMFGVFALGCQYKEARRLEYQVLLLLFERSGFSIVFASIDKLCGSSSIPRTLQTHFRRLYSMPRAVSINLRIAPSSPLGSLGS